MLLPVFLLGGFVIDSYRKNIPAFKRFLERNSNRSRYEAISEFSACHMIPVIALYVYYGEMNGFDDGVKDRMKGICEFYDYNYEDIINEV